MNKYLIFILLLTSSAFGQVTGSDIANGCGLAQSCGATIASIGTGSAVMNNNAYLKWRNAAGSADIDVLKVDGSDDTILNADTGDVIKLAIAGTAVVNVGTTGILPSVDGNNATSNLGTNSFGFKNIYLSDTTNRSNLTQSTGLYIDYPASQSTFFRQGSTNARSIILGATSDTALTQKFGDSGTTASQTYEISASTADGDDDAVLRIVGGGAYDVAGSRGAAVEVQGDNAGGTYGTVRLVTGSASNGSVDVRINNSTATGRFSVQNSSGIETMGVRGSTGAISTSSTITSSATSDLGWSAVNAANQACNTTCTSACVFGMNTGALGNFVGCADATADTCICAGAS